MNQQNRRKFLKLSALSGAFLSLPIASTHARDQIERKLAEISESRPARGASVMGLKADPMEQVKVGFIGLGNRGPGHVNHVYEKYRHPIWSTLKDEIEKNGGHGGMDFVQMYRLIDCLNKGVPLDMDVYDGVDWSVVVPLSKLSVDLGSIPIQFPDFTRGKWKGKRALGMMANR